MGHQVIATLLVICVRSYLYMCKTCLKEEKEKTVRFNKRGIHIYIYIYLDFSCKAILLG